jgi:linoleoyl-CoA desaturase
LLAKMSSSGVWSPLGLGTSLLSFSKILNNGARVIMWCSQYDWMQHPHLNSKRSLIDIILSCAFMATFS